MAERASRESLATSGRKRKANQEMLNQIIKKMDKIHLKIEIGQTIDIKAMLSSNDRDYLVSSKDGAIVPLSSLDGKYVIICSFDAGFNNSHICQSLEALYSELSLQWMDQLVKIVVVLDDDNFSSNPSAFHSFFNSLPFNCLTIPFSDYDSSHRICKSLPSRGYDNVSCLTVHPSGRVLQKKPYFLYKYGAESFPFSDEQFQMIRVRDHHIKYRLSNTVSSPITLEELLECDSLPLISDPKKFIKTSSLRNNLVGLYLYYNGQHLDNFLDIHQQCRNKGLDFEVILVPMPPFNTRRIDSVSDDMDQSVLKFPYNDKICRRLWRFYDCLPLDQLIIMPRAVSRAQHAGELYARFFVEKYGIKSYPFTREALVKKKVTRLRLKTLQSLLGNNDIGDNKNELDIRNKNIILYIVGDCTHYCGITRKINKLYPDTQLYIVPTDSDSRCFFSESGFKVLPEEKCQSVIDHIFMTDNDPLLNETVQETVVVFGKDGKILTRFGYDDMDSLTAASVFDDTLHSLISAEIQRKIGVASRSN